MCGQFEKMLPEETVVIGTATRRKVKRGIYQNFWSLKMVPITGS